MHPAGALLFIGLLAATDPTTKLTAIPYIESIEVHVNNIDVIVTDRSGHRVRGLQQGDFELRENNAPQAITNFSEFRGTDRAAVPTATERLTAPSTEARSEPQPRTFVLIFDQLSLHPAVAGALQRRANEMVEATMQPGDQLMVLTPMGRTKVALPFTSDKRAILKAIDGAMRDSAFRANTSLVSELMMYDRDVVYGGPSARFGAEAYSAVVGRRVRQTLGHLQAVVAALAEVPGKKAVIFVTQSAPAEPGREAFANLEDSTSGRPVTTSETTSTPLAPQWRTLQPYIDEIARTASSNGVTIYCLQPEVPLGPLVGDIMGGGRGSRQSGVDISSGGGFRPSLQGFMQATQGTQATFETLAETTGGKWWLGGAGIQPLFQQVADDATDYYSVGYKATEVRDQTSAVTVRVKGHPEYEVRARRAVVRKSPTNEMRDMVVARLLDDRSLDELNVRVKTGQSKREARGTYLVPVELRVPLDKLTFLREGDVYRARFRVHYAAASTAFDFAPGEGREQLVEVPVADYPTIGGKYYTFTSSMRVARGPVKFSVGVLDPLSNLATIKTMTVDAR